MPTTVDVTFLTAAGEVITKQYPVAAQKRLTLYANDDPRARRQGLQHDDHRGHRRRRRAGDVLAADRQPRSVVGGRRGQPRRHRAADHVGVRRRGGRAELRVVLPAAQPELRRRSRCTARFLPETGMPTVKTIDSRAAVTCDRLPERRARQHRRRRVDVHVRFAAVPGRALDLLGRRPRRGHQRHRRLVGGDGVALPRGRVRRPVRHLPAARQPRRQRRDRPPDAVHRRRRPLHGIAAGAAEDGARRLARDHLHERVPLRARDGRRPCGRQPARQVVQHQDRGAGRRRSGGRGRGALLELGRRQLLAQRARPRSASRSSSSGGGASGRRRRRSPPPRSASISPTAPSPATDRSDGPPPPGRPCICRSK